MQVSFEEFSRRLNLVRQQIAATCARCGREPSEVKVMAVTKTHPLEAAEWAVRAGAFAIGENRVQEAVAKIQEARFEARWELIGHLQSNKAKLAALHFNRVQSVDSAKLLSILDREAANIGRKLPILIQVNAGDDPAKFGVSVKDAGAILDLALGKENLSVDGLMTIGPLVENAHAAARRAFSRLRELRDLLRDSHGVRLDELSMGMSSDLEIAIEEGATLVRIGSALFGPR